MRLFFNRAISEIAINTGLAITATAIAEAGYSTTNYLYKRYSLWNNYADPNKTTTPRNDIENKHSCSQNLS